MVEEAFARQFIEVIEAIVVIGLDRGKKRDERGILQLLNAFIEDLACGFEEVFDGEVIGGEAGVYHEEGGDGLRVRGGDDLIGENKQYLGQGDVPEEIIIGKKDQFDAWYGRECIQFIKFILMVDNTV